MIWLRLFHHHHPLMMILLVVVLMGLIAAWTALDATVVKWLAMH